MQGNLTGTGGFGNLVGLGPGVGGEGASGGVSESEVNALIAAAVDVGDGQVAVGSGAGVVGYGSLVYDPTSQSLSVGNPSTDEAGNLLRVSRDGVAAISMQNRSQGTVFQLVTNTHTSTGVWTLSNSSLFFGTNGSTRSEIRTDGGVNFTGSSAAAGVTGRGVVRYSGDKLQRNNNNAGWGSLLSGPLGSDLSAGQIPFAASAAVMSGSEGLRWESGGRLSVRPDTTAGEDDVLEAMRLSRRTSGIAQGGFGVVADVWLDDDSGAQALAAREEHVWVYPDMPTPQSARRVYARVPWADGLVPMVETNDFKSTDDYWSPHRLNFPYEAAFDSSLVYRDLEFCGLMYQDGALVDRRRLGSIRVGAYPPEDGELSSPRMAIDCESVVVGIGGGSLGFFGAFPGEKPEVTGSRGGNAALQNLLGALALLGLITNVTTS